MSQMLNTTELAQELGVTKGRISQLVRDGRLNGCYQGDGRQRRFDLQLVAAKLQKKLHPGQMLGNGASTRRRLDQVVQEDGEDLGSAEPMLPEARSSKPAESSPLDERDPDRYELARTQKAEEEARRLRRLNAEAEGRYVLASEVSAQVTRMIGQEVAEFETVLRDAARALADEFDVDFRSARTVLLQTWRKHRGTRAKIMGDSAEAEQPTEDEQQQDI